MAAAREQMTGPSPAVMRIVGRVPQRSSMVAIGVMASSLAVAAPDLRGATTAPPARSSTKAAAPAARPALPSPEPQPLDLGPAVIKSAITAADADWAPPGADRRAFGTSSPSPQARTDRSFKAAEIERCGGPGTLKFDPLPVWGDFVIGGLLAVPYMLKAIALGHCKF